jgi:hypothetical protein
VLEETGRIRHDLLRIFDQFGLPIVRRLKKWTIMHQSFPLPRIPLPDGTARGFPNELSLLNSPHLAAGGDDVRARNRVAAKKWRDKKDEALYQLEATNDRLRQEALSLRNAVRRLQAENQILDDELRFYQSFMTSFMNTGTRPCCE